ncbi:MAG: 3-deoxy-manno-octulosonate cytidylyltransferase [Candidatus Scalindua rubra]|nr:3-deoxy-manno-octulosonate cytidylyltransferase [Candidatus Scalindua rubra]
MKIVAIIPSRMAATRFPGKPLVPILGLPMIEHVRRRTSMCELVDETIVATCDVEIKKVVESFGGKVIMTADTYDRCTDRVAEAAEDLECDIVINVQGDEPLVLPEMVDKAVSPLIEDLGLQCTNLVTKIVDLQEFKNPNAPKVVTNTFGDLLYISREPIPSRKKAVSNNYTGLKQLGIIAFRKEFLLQFSQLEPTPLEKIESVDMLRAVEHGYCVRIVETENLMIGVDVPGDIKLVENVLSSDPLVKKYI